ncbi:MAG: enoyl-CoA hydratase/isomerase family protein [Caulobacterales bacterium]
MAPAAPPATAQSLPRAVDHLEAIGFSPLGNTPVVIVDLGDAAIAEDAQALRARTRAIIVGVRPAGAKACVAPACDVVLTDDTTPLPHETQLRGDLHAEAEAIATRVRTFPHAAAILCQTLRIVERLDVSDGLHVESLAYSTLLAGGEFQAWRRRAQADAAEVPRGAAGPITLQRTDDRLAIVLNDPGARNAMSAAMRDALFEALAAALDDPTCPSVEISGAGACFSVGGALHEFGTATDLAIAHAIRTERSCARLVQALGSRCTVRLHGACIGSGFEVAAAAAHRLAAPDTFVQLPEVGMGLIPGAGGAVMLTRAIGRQRTAFLALSGRRVRITAPVLRGFAAVAAP